jgi:creatinine amidohydrolase
MKDRPMPAFDDLSARDLERQIEPGSVVVLPLGSIEQHGPHLPVSTDYVIADETARALTQLLDNELSLWRLPTLAFTKSDEHAGMAGTVWLSADTLMRVLADIGRSVAASSARRLVFLNAHGGNSALLQVACRQLRREYGLQTFLMHTDSPVDQGGGVGSPESEAGFGVHAGHVETSVMLHLRPDLVRMERAVSSVPDALRRYRHVGFGKPVSFGWLSGDFGTNGTIGDPTMATAEAGAAHFHAGLNAAADALREIAVFDPGGFPRRSATGE